MEPVITLKDVHFQYEEADTEAISGASLEIYKGEWVSLVGKNGSGKSTLSRLIDGLLEVKSGEITVMGLPVNDKNIWEIRSHIGMVFQNPDNQFVGATVEDDVAFGLENRGMDRETMIQRVKQAIDQVNMTPFLHKEPSQLSGGQKQRVALAGIIAQAPDIMILDEATSMLDPQGRKEVMDTIRMMKESYPLTIISITHDIEEVIQSDRLIVMDEGKVTLTGEPKTLFTREEGLSEVDLPLPHSEQLRRLLKKRGFDVPDYFMNEAELEEFLWTYNLKK